MTDSASSSSPPLFGKKVYYQVKRCGLIYLFIGISGVVLLNRCEEKKIGTNDEELGGALPPVVLAKTFDLGDFAKHGMVVVVGYLVDDFEAVRANYGRGGVERHERVEEKYVVELLIELVFGVGLLDQDGEDEDEVVAVGFETLLDVLDEVKSAERVGGTEMVEAIEDDLALQRVLEDDLEEVVDEDLLEHGLGSCSVLLNEFLSDSFDELDDLHESSGAVVENFQGFQEELEKFLEIEKIVIDSFDYFFEGVFQEVGEEGFHELRADFITPIRDRDRESNNYKYFLSEGNYLD